MQSTWKCLKKEAEDVSFQTEKISGLLSFRDSCCCRRQRTLMVSIRDDYISPFLFYFFNKC